MLMKDIRKEENFWRAYAEKAKIKEEITDYKQIRLIMYKMYLFLIMNIETYQYGYLYGNVQKIYTMKIVLNCT